MEKGDKVRVIKKSQRGFKIGTIGIIDRVKKMLDAKVYRVEYNNSFSWHTKRELKIHTD